MSDDDGRRRIGIMISTKESCYYGTYVVNKDEYLYTSIIGLLV